MPRASDTTSIAEERKRRKLLDLYYADGISAELFAGEEQQLTVQLGAARAAANEQEQTVRRDDALTRRFEEVAATLSDLDIDVIWQEATDPEKRVLIEQMVEQVAMFPNHLEVVVAGAPPLTVTLEEVGLQGMQNVGASGVHHENRPRSGPLSAVVGSGLSTASRQRTRRCRRQHATIRLNPSRRRAGGTTSRCW